VVGATYRVTVRCTIPFLAGGEVWLFGNTDGRWPPPLPVPSGIGIAVPHAVPGLVTVETPTTATFRADVNGAELPLTLGNRSDMRDAMCL
jgi:hypothetical protein